MVFEYKIGETVPHEKLGVVEAYCGNKFLTATIVGYDCSGTYQLYDVDVILKPSLKIRISVPVNELNKH